MAISSSQHELPQAHAPPDSTTDSTTPSVRATASDRLLLTSPPPMHPVWTQYEKDARLPMPRIVEPVLERQPRYIRECQELSAAMRAPGSRDHHLSHGIATRWLDVPSHLDGHAIPLLQYRQESDSDSDADSEASWVIVYIHGGGLHIGGADSEDLSCRRLIQAAQLPCRPNRPSRSSQPGRPGRPGTTVLLYSVGYRLMPKNPASTCVADCLDAYRHLRARHPPARFLLVGSSSGGELAAFVAQDAALKGDTAPKGDTCEGPRDERDERGGLCGVVLRCPVTSDAFSSFDACVPAHLRPLHTTATNPAFETTLLGPMRRLQPRDGLPRMPLEAPADVLRRLPPHWIQVCTNDMLYADGVCYAKALELAGVPTRVRVQHGWPHTFWLRTPWMQEALEAEQEMLEGLAWVAGV